MKKNWLVEIITIIILIFFMIIFIYLTEEKPHVVTINGKNYIRSTEYTGSGTYQVILIPTDSIIKK